MSQKAKEGTSTPTSTAPNTTPTAEGLKAGEITATGELVRVTATNTNTDPLLKTSEDYKRYQADCRIITEMQVEDIMAFQKENGYVPMRGDTSIEKHGLSSEDQEAVLRGEKRLEVIDKEKGIMRAEAIKPVKK
jgi:hypothetical protein